ncbi:mitochondrial calcium uniporter regulator 1 isoform X2 [Ambystoma mexicanum]|uniref:mitochondrial calcium uniporter regulator 1 isoform X2 n=1 Tax=Ambystoma mexicanum TaxID=8296 RepID=UPI0037E7D999
MPLAAATVTGSRIIRGGLWRWRCFTCTGLVPLATHHYVYSHKIPQHTVSNRRGFSDAPLPYEVGKEGFFSTEGKRLYFDTHALVCLLEEKGFTSKQAEIIESALIKIIDTNMEGVYKDMVTKAQQEITLQQVMSHISSVKKDMVILEKSEFFALRTQNEDDIVKVDSENKLNFNWEKSRVKEMYADSDRKMVEVRTDIIELHAQQDRGLTQVRRKLDTEVAGLKTMLESHKLDTIKYLAGSVFTCLTVLLGFFRIWM